MLKTKRGTSRRHLVGKASWEKTTSFQSKGLGVLAEPRFDNRFAYPPGLIQINQPVVSVQIIKLEFETIQQEENTGSSHCRALVAVHKRMVLGEALK